MKAIRHPLELSADSRRMGDTSQTSWTFGEMLWYERGMGSTAAGSEGPRTTGSTLGRSRTAAPGELWRQVVDPMRDNTPKKHGVGYKAQWLAPFFQSRLWQGIGRVRRTGCVPMWWHRSITFPIDRSNNKEGCNAVRLVNAFSPDSKAFLPLPLETATTNATEGLRQWMHGAQVHSAECERCRTIAQSKNQLCYYQLHCC